MKHNEKYKLLPILENFNKINRKTQLSAFRGGVTIFEKNSGAAQETASILVRDFGCKKYLRGKVSLTYE